MVIIIIVITHVQMVNGYCCVWGNQTIQSQTIQ